MAIRVIDSGLGDELLIQNAPLMAMVYDRPSKGDDLVIEVGRKQVTYGHTVYSPTEIWTAQDDNGVIRALLIKDSAKNKTIVTLE